MGKSLDGRSLPRGISQRENGLYMARYMHGGKTYTLYNRSLSQLKKELTDLKSSLEHGVYIAEDKTKLNDWFDTWMSTYCEPTKKKATSDSYKAIWAAQIKDTSLGSTRLCDLRAEQIQEFLNGLAEDYTSKYILMIKVVLSLSIMAAYRLQKIPRPIMDFVKEPKGIDNETRAALTKAEQETFKEYIKGSYLETFFLCALYTGMRSGELRGLQWGDIDSKKGFITVQRTLHEEKGGTFRIDIPKTEAGIRTIPIVPQLAEVLKTQQAFYNNVKGNILHMGSNTDYVFTVGNNYPVTVQRMRRELQRIVDNIHADGKEFPDSLVLHELRHTFCSNCAMAGMAPKVLQKIMGHSNISVTLDTYTHVAEENKADEMQKIAMSI